MTSAKKITIFLLSLSILAVGAGTTACQKKAAESAAKPAEAQKPANEFEGTVKTALGRYLYLPTAQGFDIVLQGFDASSLVGKDIRIKGELLLDHPSVFRADTVEVKDSSGAYSSAFTRSADFQMEDLIELRAREAFQPINISGANKPEEWEGKGQVKVFGKLQDAAIVVTDSKDKEIGKILVDSLTTYAKYHVQKLRLFDKFWFYLTVKESVDKKVRAKTKELFHADVVFAGLF